MQHTRFYVYGLQRSGTNFVEQALERTFSEFRRSGAATGNVKHPLWKHSINVPEELPTDAPVIVVFKSINNWIESIIDRQTMDYLDTQTHYTPQPGDQIVDAFIEKRNNLRAVQFSVQQLCKTWVHFHQQWLSAAQTHNIVYIQYEDLLTDKLEEIVQQANKKLGLDPIDWQFEKNKPARYTNRFTTARAQRYIDGQYTLTPTQQGYAKTIKSQIPTQVLLDLQAQKLGPSIPKQVYNAYLDTGQIQPYYLQQLAHKIQLGAQPDAMDMSLYRDFASSIEALLRGE